MQCACVHNYIEQVWLSADEDALNDAYECWLCGNGLLQLEKKIIK